jgi:hypothetical protein
MCTSESMQVPDGPGLVSLVCSGAGSFHFYFSKNCVLPCACGLWCQSTVNCSDFRDQQGSKLQVCHLQVCMILDKDVGGSASPLPNGHNTGGFIEQQGNSALKTTTPNGV